MRPLTVGDPAPNFTLRSSDGAAISSSDLLRSGSLVVTFYRGLWCPYCQSDLRNFDAAISSIRALGAAVLAVCHAQDGGTERPLDHGLQLEFPVLDDRSGDVAVQFGVRWSSEESRLIEEALGLEVAVFRGTEPWIVPMQARFVVDRSGEIVFSEPAFSYEQRSDPTEIMPILERLRPMA